jgi:hypothetical protein
MGLRESLFFYESWAVRSKQVYGANGSKPLCEVGASAEPGLELGSVAGRAATAISRTRKKRQLGQQPAEAVAGGGEDGVGDAASGMGETIAA